MTALRVLLARWRGLLGKDRSEQDLEEELQFHFEREIERLTAQGMSAEEARLAARKRFGGIDRAKETYRDTRGIAAVETFLRDLRYGLRALRKSPGFAAVAILSLGLGIGVNCAVFTLTNAALLRELPVDDPGRLARLSVTAKGRGRDFSYPVFRELSERQRSFTALAASGGLRPTHVVFDGVELQELGRIGGVYVSANYFQMMGIQAARGRVFTPQDSTMPGEGEVVVLRYGFWQDALGADPSVIGRALTVNGVPLTIAGIAQARFTGDNMGRFPDFWVPVLMQPRLMSRSLLDARTATFFRTLGRLKPGVSDAQAAGELTTLYQQIAAAERETGTGSRIERIAPSDWRGQVVSGAAGFNPAIDRLTKPLSLLMAVVALVLLIACCNVANLLLARGAARQHEIGTRLALGSSRGRLVRQLLTEGLLLSLLGGALGFGLAQLGTRLLETISTSVLYLDLDLRPDARVLAFTAVVSLVTTLIFGILPAIQATSVRPSVAHAPASRFRQRVGRLLVVVQVALSLWLLVGAGLLLRSLQNLRSADIGLDRAHVSTVVFDAEADLAPAELSALQGEIAARVSALPGVRSVAHSSLGLFAKGGLTAPALVPASGVEPARDREMYIGYVSAGFFPAVGMELARGRDFREQDSPASQKVGIVSEAVARHYFGDRDPIGEAIYFPGIDAQGRYIPFNEGLSQARRYEIVGVVRDAFDRGPREAPAHRIYLPLAQSERFAETLYLRTSGDPAALTPSLLQVLREFASRVRVEEVTTLEQQLSQNYPLELFGARLLTFFGALALVLAAVGLYGVMSYAVSRRTAEVGVRMALGAAPGRVLAMILRETFSLVLVGIAIGTAAALASAGILEGAMFGLSSTDPATIAGVILVLSAVAMLAGYVPARRAARVDPMVALRHE